MLNRETARLKPEEISPQNRRAACYLHYDLRTIAVRLAGLSSLLNALSDPETDDYYLRNFPGALAFAAISVDDIFCALDEISSDIARPHGLLTSLKAPDWWQQVEERRGTLIEKSM